MANEINFVGKARKRLTASQKKDKQFYKIAVAVVSFSFIVFLISLGARFYFISQYQRAEAQNDTTRDEIIEREGDEESYTIFSYKLKALSELFSKRSNKQSALIFFNQVFGPRVSISSIDYVGDQQEKLSFTVSAPDVFTLNSVLEVLQSQDVTSTYKSVQKNGLRRKEDGSYDMQLTLVFGDQLTDEQKRAPRTVEDTLGLTDEEE